MLESGHHAAMWLDVELLCLRPEPVQRLAHELAARLDKYQFETVCGPLIEGAFVGLMVASALGVRFTYSERIADRVASQLLYPFKYRIPMAVRAELYGKRVAIINDVVNAGSAVRGTFEDLKACGAEPVVIGSLAVLGNLARTFAEDQKLGLEALASFPNELWAPATCPLCVGGVPLMNDPDSV